MHAPRPERSRYDAIVVGARCAGASTALLLARRGLHVLVVDRAAYGSDTLSTHALMRGGVVQLHRWGLLGRLRDAGTPVVRRTTFHYGDDLLAVDIKPRDGVDGLYAPRRTVLDALLVDAAVEAGAEVIHGVRAADVVRGPDGRVVGLTLENAGGAREAFAGTVIGADGVRSAIAQRVGAETLRTARHATGTIYGYYENLPVDGYHWYYRPGISAGAIPTNDGRTCVFATVSDDRFANELRFDLEAGHARVVRACAPDLADALAGARRIGRMPGYPGIPGFLRRSHGPGWALVGDAGYFRDPLTAHGITDALRDAELLARAVAAGTERAFGEYQAARDDLVTPFFEVTDRIASFDWDLGTVQEMHKFMSAEMNREVAAILALDPPVEAVGAA